ncbi:Tetratricopeptide repeat (TPR)-like superfamily protein [Thalictrum thalictroides]|uniref:Tetratricopeptide repeat (TPR)-like superfamily protein n=1 Tax=Thalictrum thalictroides TaxID=46969 RepID=A0A7J6VAZ5_THATH|nr:Tetratricopeptide repeat (TPR)-like superfamily protein [Thalictrum thalictroides]
MSDAQKCFEEMPERNIVSWTSLMVDYSTNGDPEEVLQIYQKMGHIHESVCRYLRKMIKEVGYVPDMSFALHDTDEEDKEHNLWNHSENLRVCDDCHSVYKFVRRAVQRRIILC